jgi:S1-C subfamily serine protease
METNHHLILGPLLAASLILLGDGEPLAAEKDDQQWFEINTVLMESTIKIEGPNSLGTGFIVGRPILDAPGRSRFTLVTAAHVLEDIKGEIATLHMREKTEGKWNKVRLTVKIRDGKAPLYVRHKEADVAAMYVSAPKNMINEGILGTQLLMDDDDLRQFEVHPGDEIFALGFPLGLEANEAGFPVLRSGKIASYPLLPTRQVKTFLFDFRVFKGNSGGPVYFFDSGRVYAKKMHRGVIRFIMGLVSKEALVTEKIKSLYVTREENYQLGLAEVVHSSLIKETIAMLPPALEVLK